MGFIAFACLRLSSLGTSTALAPSRASESALPRPVGVSRSPSDGYASMACSKAASAWLALS
eukprot:scaffold105392_cov30-Tisochrysis_lutea.AAC.2